MHDQRFYPQRLVFWEPSRSPHKEALFDRLARMVPPLEVICCAEQELSQERRAQGWQVNATTSFQTLVAPSPSQIDQLVGETVGQTLHIFSGIRWLPTLVEGLRAVRRHGAQFAIMSEPRVREGWKGALRVAHSWLTEGWLRRHAAFVLAQGRNGPPWFRLAGYRDECIFPFAYFVEPSTSEAPDTPRPPAREHRIHIGYVGRLVEMKGVRLLIEAAARLGPGVQLAIVGTGPDEAHLKAMCGRLNVDAEFPGVVPIQRVGGIMQQLDVLVLPSTSKDGWGVVVSEALMSGTAAIATECVGASIALEDPLMGRCVSAHNPPAIAQAITELVATGSYSAEARTKRLTLARLRFSAEAGARHLMEIVRWRFEDGVRPVPFYATGMQQRESPAAVVG